MLGRRTGGQADGRCITHRVLSGIRRMAGMPDYAAHLEHLRRTHPEKSIPSEREFYEEFVRNRYQDGPTRCC